MTAKQQLSDATYDEIVRRYVAGEPLQTIQNQVPCARATIYKALDVRGVPRQERKPGPRSCRAERPARKGETYDHFRKYVQRECKCGCGRKWRVVHGQAARQWAKDCPVGQKHLADRKTEYSRAQSRRRAAQRALHGGATREPPATLGRVSQQLCHDCGGLSWRRPLGGCSCGGLPAPEQLSEEYHDLSRKSGLGG